MLVRVGGGARTRCKLASTEFNKVDDRCIPHNVLRDEPNNQVAASAHLSHRQIKLQSRRYFSVLLSHLNQLCDVLHAADWLEDLPADHDDVCAVDKVCPMLLRRLNEVRDLLFVPLLLGLRMRRQHQQICQFVLVNLHNGTIKQTVIAAPAFLRFGQQFFSCFECEVDFDIAVE